MGFSLVIEWYDSTLSLYTILHCIGKRKSMNEYLADSLVHAGHHKYFLVSSMTVKIPLQITFIPLH